MKTSLPIILSAGYFDSKNKFPNVKNTQPRKVECFELEIFSESSGCSFINEEKYPIERGNILFAKPGDIRYSRLPFGCDFLHFNNIPQEFVDRFNLFPPVFRVNDFDGIKENFSKIIKNYCSEYSVDKISASARLLLLLKDITATNTDENSLAQKAKQIIQANYMNDLTVPDIARKCFISTSYLHKIYCKAFGVGPAEALLNHRLYKAKGMIINTDLSLGDIAQKCGFGSQSYFSDCFKRKTGITPKEFRANNTISF